MSWLRHEQMRLLHLPKYEIKSYICNELLVTEFVCFDNRVHFQFKKYLFVHSFDGSDLSFKVAGYNETLGEEEILSLFFKMVDLGS